MREEMTAEEDDDDVDDDEEEVEEAPLMERIVDHSQSSYMAHPHGNLFSVTPCSIEYQYWSTFRFPSGPLPGNPSGFLPVTSNHPLPAHAECGWPYFIDSSDFFFLLRPF